MTATIASPAAVTHRRRSPLAGAAASTWLGHRAALVGLGLLFAAFAVAIVVPGAAGNSAYGWYVAHHCAASPAATSVCGEHLGTVLGQHTWANLVGLLLLLVPLVAGVFVGAPLVAKEIESGTYRFTWTQGIGRTRYELRRLVVLAAVAVVGAAVLGLLMGWFVHPLEAVGQNSRFDARLFNSTVLALPAWTLFSLALGVAIGVGVRRTVPAMAATAVVVGAVLVFAGEPAHGSKGSLTTRLLGIAPVTARSHQLLYTFSGATTGSRLLPKGSWVVRSWARSPSGKVLVGSTLWALLSHRPAAQPTPQAWLVAHHYSFWYSFQPAGRYWMFEVLMAAAAVVLAAALLLLALKLVRRFG